MNVASSTKQLSNRLEHLSNSLKRRVVAVFQVRAMMCCELEGDLLVGGQIAKEHGNVEIVLGPIANLPAVFAPALRVPHPWQLLLLGRKFRGFVTSRRTGDVSVEFGRYKMRFARDEGMTMLDIGTDTPESCDLPEDALLSIAEQLTHFEGLVGRDSRLT